MAAFVIREVSIQYHKEYEEYKKLSPAAVAAYKGRFVVRGGQSETLKGDRHTGRMLFWNFRQLNGKGMVEFWFIRLGQCHRIKNCKYRNDRYSGRFKQKDKNLNTYFWA